MAVIFMDTTFIDTKAHCVYNKLNALSGGFSSMIQKFDGDFPVAHLRFKTNPNMVEDGVKGATSPPIGYIIDITLNGNPSKSGSYQQRPNLLVAKTIVHEVIHAEMFRKLLSIANNGGNLDGLTVQDLNNMASTGDFPGIFDYYTRFGGNLTNFQHPQMAAHYREVIADALEEFDQNGNTRQFYEDLAWEGLNYYDDPTWQALPQAEKNRIEGVINTYINQNKNQTCP